MGHASYPGFAIPMGAMVFVMYVVIVSILTEKGTQGQNLAGSIITLCLSILFGLGMTGVLSNKPNQGHGHTDQHELTQTHERGVD